MGNYEEGGVDEEELRKKSPRTPFDDADDDIPLNFEEYTSIPPPLQTPKPAERLTLITPPYRTPITRMQIVGLSCATMYMFFTLYFLRWMVS